MTVARYALTALLVAASLGTGPAHAADPDGPYVCPVVATAAISPGIPSSNDNWDINATMVCAGPPGDDLGLWTWQAHVDVPNDTLLSGDGTGSFTGGTAANGSAVVGGSFAWSRTAVLVRMVGEIQQDDKHTIDATLVFVPTSGSPVTSGLLTGVLLLGEG